MTDENGRAEFEIDLTTVGRYSTVKLNGDDISSQIDSIWIHANSRDATTVEVRFIGANVRGMGQGQLEVHSYEEEE